MAANISPQRKHPLTFWLILAILVTGLTLFLTIGS